MTERSTKSRPGERTVPDGLVDALAGASTSPGKKVLLVDELFGHRPQVLEAIAAAYRRGVGAGQIAQLLSKEASVGETAVKAWLKRHDVTRPQ